MPTPEQSAIKRIEQLEAELRQVRRLLERPESIIPRTRVRLAKKVGDNNGSVSDIVFVDADYAPAAGDQAVDITDHAAAAQTVARELSDGLIAVLEQPGVTRRHFIIGGGGESVSLVARAKLAQDMCPDDCLVSVACVRGASEAVSQVNNWGFVGKSGDIVYIAKIGSDAGSGSESGGDCDLECDQGSESGDSPEWEIISVTPRKLCPLSDVIATEDCLYQVRSTMYGYECERTASATKIIDLTDCDAGSGSESGGCDMDPNWNLSCPDEGSGSETGGE